MERWRCPQSHEWERKRWPKGVLDVYLDRLPRTRYHPHDDTQGYRVYLEVVIKKNGEPERVCIGRVESRREEVHRQYNKMLGSLIGNPKHWLAQTVGRATHFPQPVGYHHRTRAAAIVALVNNYLEES